METFNKYAFIQDLTSQLKTEIKEYEVHDMDKITDLVDEYIDNACIYYSDCFDICKELNATDFSAYDVECNNINQLAFACLYEFVREELDYNELEELIIEKVNA